MKDHPFTRNFRLYLIIPAAIVVLAVVLTLAGQGMNLGVDFTGGSIVHYDLKAEFATKDVEALLKTAGASNYRITKSGSKTPMTQVQIRLGGAEVDGTLVESVTEALAAKYEGAEAVYVTEIDKTAGTDLLVKAALASLTLLICTLIYIGLRLGFYSGIAAFLTLLHDCLVACAIMVFLRSVLFMDIPTAGALFAVMALSINNAVLLLYRIRERGNLAKYARAPKMEIAEDSVNAAFPRTVSVSLIVLVGLIVAYALGAYSVRQFILPLAIGTLASTYSALFLCAPIWASFAGRKQAKA